ncbi:hypothetical protein EXE49_16695 [Halorubrum sp. ASP121]|uniref:hypothetical protein n=1 Tax=Halorubrum sp. ASP121 TaxID=1855858 RepID=UPI0010F7B0EE|nr:hypothetical protein [Halorubrum sp. ASP121]TKX48248.1 hypothetical protein EXE49_16695 [Halorubrum sp. ASP121]
MGNSDEGLLTAAKLAEQLAGNIDTDRDLASGAGALDPDDVSASVFLDDLRGYFDRPPELLSLVDRTQQSRQASEAIRSGNSLLLSHLVGITEQDLDASALRLPLRLDDVMTNNDTTAFIGGAGNPNTGKTNLMALLAELRSATVDDLLVISNSRTWPRTDIVVTSAHDLAVTCIEHRDRPKFVFIDEGSTHFDARTNSYEVAAQFSPLAKRLAKVNVDVFGTVFHTGKDCHPELKRLFTTAYFKHSKKEVDFFADWPADADKPTNQLFSGTVENLEPASAEPDPDDAAPWNWNLEPDLFSKDLDWPDLLDELCERGPAT